MPRGGVTQVSQTLSPSFGPRSATSHLRACNSVTGPLIPDNFKIHSPFRARTSRPFDLLAPPRWRMMTSFYFDPSFLLPSFVEVRFHRHSSPMLSPGSPSLLFRLPSSLPSSRNRPSGTQPYFHEPVLRNILYQPPSSRSGCRTKRGRP